jgi:GT2 family glycosyltransferase
MLLTVLICTHDRAELLQRVLDSLNAARRPAGGAQLLVGANNCSDGTHALLQAYANRPGDCLPLRWLAVPAPGKSHALNEALPQVDTPLVALVDDDHRVDAGYLEAICRAAHDHPQADLFCGRILPDWDGSEPAWVHDAGPYRIYPLPVPRFDQGDAGCDLPPGGRAIPGGGNLFLRTPWAAKIGDFATEMGPRGHDLGGAEDLDWVLRGLRLGARLRYVPEVVQLHYVDTSRLTLSYLVKKAYKRTASTQRLEPGEPVRGVPRYLYRKIAGYALRALTALDMSRRRFYCVRTAAALGEISGHLAARRSEATATMPRDGAA